MTSNFMLTSQMLFCHEQKISFSTVVRGTVFSFFVVFFLATVLEVVSIEKWVVFAGLIRLENSVEVAQSLTEKNLCARMTAFVLA